MQRPTPTYGSRVHGLLAARIKRRLGPRTVFTLSGPAINSISFVYIVSFNPYYELSEVVQLTIKADSSLLYDRINSCQKLRF
ncbi:hypothetical protein JOF46_000564 [Paeniglutamicibacter psychrophenolicus]|uniref:Uncharacterized protein n=1 Tax=Paeniglutamicibacter psychrophenolicus TaxID=257454 RepID=A0ABS4W8W7_9MICC|nr:hypothetical protein [Paeniglutamicibacter psychrophenolicus]